MPQFKVRVSKDYTVFCSGHFITYEGDKCEALHSHNYRAAATVEGELGEDAYVFDFNILKRLLRVICDRLDHKMLLPLYKPNLSLSEAGDEITVRYVFPRAEVVLLPIPNTTAEKIAEWIGGELEAELRVRGTHGLTAWEVEVEESFGQAATCHKALSG